MLESLSRYLLVLGLTPVQLPFGQGRGRMGGGDDTPWAHQLARDRAPAWEIQQDDISASSCRARQDWTLILAS